MQYAPLPTEDQLARVSDAVGAGSLTHAERIEGGLGCTTDVLAEGSQRLILRRYGSWYAERGEDAADREARALELLQKSNVAAPAPIWVDTDGVFDEQAIVISYVDGSPDLTPSHPFDWAEQLAATLARIHEIKLEGDDAELFGPSAGEDEEKIQNNPELILAHPLGEDLLRRRYALGQRRVDADQVFSHTDYWPGNTLWRDGDLAAVIDWEHPATNDRAMDVTYCWLDIRYLGMDAVADRFVAAYREVTGAELANMRHWEAIALCRPMPDIAEWVPAWRRMGREIDDDRARQRHTELIEDFLARTE